jgi:hypothetical protein
MPVLWHRFVALNGMRVMVTFKQLSSSHAQASSSSLLSTPACILLKSANQLIGPHGRPDLFSAAVLQQHMSECQHGFHGSPCTSKQAALSRSIVPERPRDPCG